MEYFIDIGGQNKAHSLRVVASFTPGDKAVTFPRNEAEFLTPSDPDEVDVEEVYLCYNNKERKIINLPEKLLSEIEQKIIEQETGENYVV